MPSKFLYQFFLKIVLNCGGGGMCLCVGMYTWGKMPTESRGGCHLDLGLHVVVSFPKWVLQTTSTLNHCTISPAHLYQFFTYLTVCAFFQRFFKWEPVGHKLRVFFVSRRFYLSTSSATHLAVSAQSVRTFIFSPKFENISFLSFGFCYLKTICLIQSSLLLYNFIFSIGYFWYLICVIHY